MILHQCIHFLCRLDCDDECFSSSERSLSPSDTDVSSLEMTGCYDLHGKAEEDEDIEDEEQEISENGQEVLYQTNTNCTCAVSSTKHVSPKLEICSKLKSVLN